MDFVGRMVDQEAADGIPSESSENRIETVTTYIKFNFFPGTSQPPLMLRMTMYTLCTAGLMTTRVQ